jgi:peptidoglycan hydrolase-like protein with peptidoglycan-binding domain
LLAAGFGTSAIAIGVLVGYLVNGPPQHPLVSRVVADTSSAEPSAERVQTGTPAAPALAAPPPAAAAPAVADASAAAVADASAAAAQMPTAEVREVQGRLRAMGFNPGPVDGIIGPLTENAAKQYQRARGLEVTGAVDRTLLVQLRQEPPPPRRYSGNSYASKTAAAHRRPRNDFNDFLDNLDRLFRR